MRFSGWIVGQNSTVVIPTLKRPEFLALVLESIEQAKSAPSDVRIFVDVASDEVLDDVEFVRNTYFPSAQIFHANPHVEAPSGAWNILHAIQQGFKTGCEFVHLIEEDVRVFKDYFDWCLETHQSGDYF